MNRIPKDGVVALYESFFDADFAAHAFMRLRESLNWHREQIRILGKWVNCPRRVAAYGDAGISYGYSGNTHRARGWPAAIQSIKDRVAQALQQRFNFVLCNYYRDGDDYMGWHEDSEAELGKNPVIASVSLGAARRFDLRHKTDGLTESVLLTSGSLLVMSGATQQHWKHRLPKQKSCQGDRINLSFRQIETGG